MDAVFFLLLLSNFGVGAFCLIFLLAATMEPPDPGATSLSLPFFPLLSITLLQIIDYYLQYRVPGRPFIAIDILYDVLLVMIAFSWNYIAFSHYHSNGVDRLRKGALRFLGIVAITLILGFTIGHIRVGEIVPYLRGVAMVMLFHAAIKGILVITKTDRLYPSSQTALTIASISLVVYPLVAVGDALGWRLPFLDQGVTFWAQAHPVYVTTVTIPLFFYTYHNRIWSVGKTAPYPGTLRPTVRLPARTGVPLRAPPEETSPGETASEVTTVDARPTEVTPADVTSSQVTSPGATPVNPTPTFVASVDAITRKLTPRENEILLLLYEGYRYREIAQMLFVSLTTVRTHIHHIYEKLDISRKEELFIVIRDAKEAAANRSPDRPNPQI